METFLEILTQAQGPLGALVVVIAISSAFAFALAKGWLHTKSSYDNLKATSDAAIKANEVAFEALREAHKQVITELKEEHQREVDYAHEEVKIKREQLNELNKFLREQAIPAIIRFTDLEVDRARRGSAQ